MVNVSRPLVALISATPSAIAPAEAAFAHAFPAALLWNILDDRLLIEATSRGGLDDELQDRMGRLIDHALAGGAAGVLLTCSMYSPVALARSAASPAAVLAPDDAAFKRITELAPRRLLVVGSLPAALQDSCDRLRAELATVNAPVDVTGALADGAFAASSSGDSERLYESIRDAITAHGGPDRGPVFLAQYSLAPAARLLAKRMGVTVITGPDCAAEYLRRRLARMEGA